MRASAFETILPSGPITALPLSLLQTPSRSSPLLLLALALPAAVAALTPFSLIAAHAAQDATMFVERPETSIKLGLALVLWAVVFGWPIVARARTMGTQRRISIGSGDVIVTERRLVGATTWQQPVSSYRGIAHHVRASLSGTRHELLLIHPDPARSILLRAADKISQGEIDELAGLLGCREIAPQVYYRNTVERARRRVTSGRTALAGVEL